MRNQVIVITGASSGIGAALAEDLGRQQTKLVLAARTAASLEVVAAKVRASGSEAVIVPTDMGDPEQVRNLARTTLAHYGRIDALVNNAGYGQYGPISELSETLIRKQFEVNVFGLLMLTQHFIPTFRMQRKGRIINISSIAGVITLPFGGLYHASKHAVEAITDALRMELAPFNIQVIAIQPGPVKTKFLNVAQDTSDQYNIKGSPYEAVYAKVQAQYAKVFEEDGIEVEGVIRLIRQALTDPNPQDRYVAFKGGAFLLGLLKNMPTALKDSIFRGQFGLDRDL